MNRPYLEGCFRITPVSPIAVCSGDRIPPMEIRQAGSQVHILDLRAYLADTQVPMAQRLRAIRTDGTADIPPGKHVRYTLPLLWNPAPQPGLGHARPAGRPGQYGSFGSYAAARGRGPAPGASPYGITEILQAIKDSRDRPYLPGSSLKGAVRTALAAALWNSLDENARGAAIERGISRGEKKFAAKFLEEALFGGPNAVLDALKLLVVRDSATLPPGRLALGELWVMTPGLNEQLARKQKDRYGKPKDFRSFIEVLLPAEGFSWEQPFLLRHFETRTDRDYALPPHALGPLAAPQKLLETLRDFGQQILQTEAAFYQKYGQKSLADFTTQLASRAKTETASAYLPVGFGTGWRTKTVAIRLQPGGVDALRTEFSLDQGRSPGKFPKTRKILFKDGQPWRPLGWLKIELAP